MPIFEYRCAVCDASFEELTSAAAPSRVRCRSCGSADVTRLLSAFAVGGGAAVDRGAPVEPGGCGACGAPRRGMCGEG
jgi:putative FmdB family regulatory protein